MYIYIYTYMYIDRKKHSKLLLGSDDVGFNVLCSAMLCLT